MTDAQVTQYDPTKLMDAVRDRIKAEFIGLIPEDVWKKMVDAEVQSFFEKGKESNYYDTRVTPSKFQRVVWEEMEKETRARMKTVFESGEWTTHFDGKGAPQAGAEVKKLLLENSGEIVSRVLQGMFQQTMDQLRARM